MNAKFRNIGRVSLRPSAREREPMKLTRKKIAYLVEADNNNSDVSEKYERETRTAIKGIKKLPIKQQGQESARLFSKAGPRAAGFELAPLVRRTRNHTAACHNRLCISNLITRTKGEKT